MNESRPDPDAAEGSGGVHNVPSTPSGGSEGTDASTGGRLIGAGGTSSGGADTAPSSDFLAGVYDPNEVYIFGTLQPGSCSHYAWTHYSTPEIGVVGFDCEAAPLGINPVSHRFVYDFPVTGNVFEFVPEGEASPDPRAYPEATETNDIELVMPCPRGNDFLSPETGQVLRSCCEGAHCRYLWPDGTELAVPAEEYEIMNLGYEQSALLSDSFQQLYVLAPDGAIIPVDYTAVPTSAPRFSRSHTEGFRLLTMDDSSGMVVVELRHISFDGTVEYLGVYPPSPDVDVVPYFCKLDTNDAYFCQGWEGESHLHDVIIRGQLGKPTEIVYNELTDPLVQLHISYLVTGP